MDDICWTREVGHILYIHLTKNTHSYTDTHGYPRMHQKSIGAIERYTHECGLQQFLRTNIHVHAHT